MSREGEYLVFAAELYRHAKGLSGAEVAALFEKYGVSKFINGFIADRTNARWHLVVGLSICALLNYIFGFSADLSHWITGQADGPDKLQQQRIHDQAPQGLVSVTNGAGKTDFDDFRSVTPAVKTEGKTQGGAGGKEIRQFRREKSPG